MTVTVADEWPVTRGSYLSVPVVVGVSILVLLPLSMVAVGQGNLGRYAFLLCSCAFGLYLYLRWRADYFGFCIWLFLLTPWARRVLDMDAGWLQANPALLAPYLVTGLSGISCLAYLFRADSRHALPIVLILASIAYGLLVAVLYGRASLALLEVLRWAVPWLLVGFLVHHAEEIDRFVRVLIKTFTVALPVLGAYGIWQFWAPPLWDQVWMLNAPMDSIGSPAPFEIRVFGTMNSPGSTAAALTVGLLFCAARPGPGLILGASLSLIAFMLTVQRASIAAFLLVAAGMLMLATERVRISMLFVFVLMVTVALPVIFLVPELHELMSERVQTTLNLGQDVSARARLGQYYAFPSMVDESPLGRGLGWVGRNDLLADMNTVVFDSTIIRSIIALGLLGGLIYLTGILLCSVRVLRGALQSRDPILHASAGMTAFGLLQLPTWGGHAYETGMMTCIGIGVGLALLDRSAYAES